MTDVDATPAADPEPDDTEDSVKLLSNGKIRVTIDGQVYRLRLPRLGQYRHCRELITEGVEQVQAAARKGETYDEVSKVAEFVQAVFNGDDNMRPLSDRPLEMDQDDWPAWLVGGNFTSQVMTHWREVPLGPG